MTDSGEMTPPPVAPEPVASETGLAVIPQEAQADDTTGIPRADVSHPDSQDDVVDAEVIEFAQDARQTQPSPTNPNLDKILADGNFTPEQIEALRKEGILNETAEKTAVAGNQERTLEQQQQVEEQDRVRANYEKYWGKSGSIPEVLKAQVTPEAVAEITDAFRAQAILEAQADPGFKVMTPSDQAEAINQHIEEYMAAHDAEIQAKIAEKVKENTTAAIGELKGKSLEDAIGQLTGTEGEARKNIVEDFFKSLAASGMEWVVEMAKMAVTDIDWGQVMDFMLNPSAYGRSSSGRFEAGTERGEKIWDLDNFKDRLKKDQGAARFALAIGKTIDENPTFSQKMPNAREKFTNQANREKLSTDQTYLREAMTIFLEDFFDGGESEINQKWQILRTEGAKYFTGEAGKMYSQEIGNFLEELKDNPTQFSEYFPEKEATSEAAETPEAAAAASPDTAPAPTQTQATPKEAIPFPGNPQGAAPAELKRAA